MSRRTCHENDIVGSGRASAKARVDVVLEGHRPQVVGQAGPAQGLVVGPSRLRI